MHVHSASHYPETQGATSTVRMLLAAGANVQALDQQGRTALMYAAHNYTTSEDTVRTLLQAGVDVHSRDQGTRSGCENRTHAADCAV